MAGSLESGAKLQRSFEAPDRAKRPYLHHFPQPDRSTHHATLDFPCYSDQPPKPKLVLLMDPLKVWVPVPERREPLEQAQGQPEPSQQVLELESVQG